MQWTYFAGRGNHLKKNAEHLWCRSLTMLIIIWSRFELETKFKVCCPHKHTNKPWLGLPDHFQQKEQEQANLSWRRWFALRIISHDQKWKWQMTLNDAAFFFLTASSYAGAAPQCHNKTLQMSWKTKRAQHHTGQAKTAEQFSICVCMWACIRFTYIRPVQHYYCTPQCKYLAVLDCVL